MSPAPQRIIWAELSGHEVRAQLQRMAHSAGGKAVTGFLDTHQWSSLAGDLQLQLEGGHPQAQFRRAGLGVLPQVRHFHVPRGALPEGARTARQLRGWLYRGGLPDGAVGDIVVGEHVAMAVEEDVEPAEFGLPARLVPGWQPPVMEPSRVTAAGPRIDAVVAALFKVSRGEAQTAIQYGFIFCDFRRVEKQTQQVLAGAQLVYRTKGRAEVLALNENTKSGRLWVEFRLYPA